MSIEIRDISKRYGMTPVLERLSLQIETGQLVALLGPSGCGKTTLLRLIAGLEQPDTGAVHFHGEDATHLHVRHRRVGFVFQHYALFPHLSVFENIAFGLRVRPRRDRPPEVEIRQRVQELLELVQLGAMANRRPAQLSGGQRQRVALARALAVQPRVLLLDEPFGALDAQVRKDLRRWLRRLHDELHVTSVFVTHDQEEAMEVADRVIVMNRGRVEQDGPPQALYDHPASAFVSTFIGQVNRLPARIAAGWADLDGWRLPVPEHAGDTERTGSVHVRPHDFHLAPQPQGPEAIAAQIVRIYGAGPWLRLELRREADGQLLEVEVPRGAAESGELAIGTRVYAHPRRTRVFLEAVEGEALR